ncbi:16S rRNA (guanine(966)-N(2))-methyltransferase RsmD [Calothrix sp. UHCC 0171]|uniref:16S rRNA (guanine(966)-N(2))-methyltransferase RsmD n=1 Tax=Calothrix sp. UHCC 0171 TaxID=3110245 RepID=UPI002B1F312E|nr:16S rRNA (guanine(966)-N(2))-methyltransferase RsmD [Calothrix sp. UHCC 0171]MEA5570268.1 16S rRNA (guanine(966)-N(2))-methyltransferase RsmD [Calothrix sp. UHCC 0171]
MSLRIYGNRLLKTLPGQATRPTIARVREALFNIWQGKISSCRWLDICTGSGSMGAEALCRGANLVVGMERSSQAYRIIQENWQKVATQDQKYQIFKGDVLKQLPKLAGQQFDRIYFDPPYASGLYAPVLEAIAQYQLLETNGEIAVEHDSEGWSAPNITAWEICRQKTYGNTGLTFYRVVENGE